MNYLCDTNIISEVMKRQPHPVVETWVNQQALVRLSVITVEEIWWGLTYKDAHKQSAWFERFVELRCNVLPVTTAIAKRCGQLRGNFRRQGVVRTQADLLMAATALEHSLALMTRNTKDFEDCGVELFNPFLLGN